MFWCTFVLSMQRHGMNSLKSVYWVRKKMQLCNECAKSEWKPFSCTSFSMFNSCLVVSNWQLFIKYRFTHHQIKQTYNLLPPNIVNITFHHINWMLSEYYLRNIEFDLKSNFDPFIRFLVNYLWCETILNDANFLNELNDERKLYWVEW